MDIIDHKVLPHSWRICCKGMGQNNQKHLMSLLETRPSTHATRTINGLNADRDGSVDPDPQSLENL